MDRTICIQYCSLKRHRVINPFAPGDFAKKRVLKLVEWFSGHCCAIYKELKLTTNLFTGRTLHGLLFQMHNISLRSSGMSIKQNFKIVFGFKNDTAVLTCTFRFLSFPLFSLFLPHFFFSCWAFSRLHFGGKSFRKAFRILGLGERYGRWAMEQDFHGDLQVNLT